MRYLYIGEIAELLGVSKDTIRIYEEQGLIFPVRDENGFRRYTRAGTEVAAARARDNAATIICLFFIKNTS